MNISAYYKTITEKIIRIYHVYKVYTIYNTQKIAVNIAFVKQKKWISINRKTCVLYFKCM